jgi:hypothetical protein
MELLKKELKELQTQIKAERDNNNGWASIDLLAKEERLVIQINRMSKRNK